MFRVLRSLGPLVALALAPAAVQEDPAPDDEPILRPTRVRLFDLMDRASLEGMPGPAEEPAGPRRRRFDFEPGEPGPEVWLRRGRSWESDPGPYVARIDGGGVDGGFLRLHGDLPDRSVLSILVPATGMARYRIRGRVRLVDNPRVDEASSREVLQVVEHGARLLTPTLIPGFLRRRATVHQVSRTRDPSGWDHFDIEFLSAMSTRSLELHLLHRSGEAASACTDFDAIEILESEVGEGEILRSARRRLAPRDGQAAATPWRSRVALSMPGGKRKETRDALLLPAPARLGLALHLPAPEDRPVLRFGWGMSPDALRSEGDGVVLRVRFAPEGARPQTLFERSIDAKNRAEHRCWFDERVDLAALAGESGLLSFEVEDVADSEADLLDHVVLSSPRIEPAEAVPPVMNVLLIGCDTLRADRLSAYGYSRDTSPNLRRLADAGIRFSRCRAQAPWTLPSFSSILTSLYPSVHGAGRGGHDEWTPIDPGSTSLAEVLARTGYRTQGVTANFLISPRYGLDQGFEAYREMGDEGWSMESVALDAPAVADFVRENGSSPYFLFWHIMDSHLPYDTEPRYREAFTDPEYRGRFGGRRPQVPFQVLDPRPGRRWYAHEGPPPAPDLLDEDRRFVHDYYDAEIAELDAGIGQVLDALVESGQWDRTIVALVADHGEGLGDHDHYHHGYTLYDDQVHVPLLLRIPGRDEGRVIERPVASIDLAPTLLGALGLETPAFFQGVDRLAEDAPEDDPVLLEYPTYDSSALKAYVRGRFKYLHDPLFHVEALYDTEADPGETLDVKAEHPDFVAEARAALDAFRWESQQKGRYHLRIHGAVGQRLELTIRTDDLFDANFVSRPLLDEHDFQMGPARQSLRLETVLREPSLELVFWCRGRDLRFDLRLDGEELPGGLRWGREESPEGSRTRRPAGSIPCLDGVELPMPPVGAALAWLEGGVEQTLPVVPTPEEIERLRALGYAH